MDNHNITQENTIGVGVKAIWRHLRPFKSQLFVLLFFGLISAVANGFIPYITGRFFDVLIDVSRGIESGETLPLWMLLLGIWALIQFIANSIDWISDRLVRNLTVKNHLGLQSRGFGHLFHLPLSFHKNEQINKVIEEISRAGWRVSNLVHNVVQISPQFLSIIIGITLAASINLILAGVLALGMVVYTILLVFMLRSVSEIDEKMHDQWAESWGDAAAAAHQIESVKQAAADDYETQRVHDSLYTETGKSWQAMERTWNNVNFVQRMVVFTIQLTIFIVSVQFISRGIISVGDLVALNGYSLMFLGPLVQLGHSWQIIQNGLTSATKADRTFRTPIENYQPYNGISLKNITGKIEFKNVSFSYETNQPIVLSDVTFKVEQGEVIALVGESGVGKSTAVSLISAYYFPTKGKVLIDEVSTKELNLMSLRKHIAVVPQEVALFNNSIRMNIKYGSFNATLKEVERAAKEAHISEFIDTLPDRYETIVGERGIKLSVGQKQRVAIARAILRNPKILILDEPTSALDARTEQFISESLEKLMKGRTTFIIAHRLSTVRKADKILVFEKGRIVETGKHNELIKLKNGIYRRLYEYQVGLHN